MTLTKQDLTDMLIEKHGMAKKRAKYFVEAFFEELKDTLENGEEVKLSGFGNFSHIDKCSRPGRNPKTREPVEITARRVITFRPGLKLRKRCE
ncbi:MAG: integration host factor subunit alpha [Vibrio splendidus]